MKHTLAVFSMICMFLWANAQIFNSSLYSYTDTSFCSKTQLRLDYLGAMKNNEYFKSLVLGYTLFSNQLQTYFVLPATKKINLNIGLLYNQFFGQNKFSLFPLISLRLHPLPTFKFTFGTLPSSHNMLNQLYGIENTFFHPYQNGAQILYSTKYSYLEIWTVWKQFIHFNDNKPEKIQAGISWKQTLINSNNLKINAIAQTTFDHTGGQIDTSHTPTTTIFNSAIGLSSELHLNDLTLSFAYFNLQYKNLTKTNVYPFLNGSAQLSTVQLLTRHLNLAISYWKAYHFIAPLGQLYEQNYNPFTHKSENSKNTLNFWLDLHKTWPKQHLSFHLGAYSFYNLPTSHLDYGYYFHFIYHFRLTVNK